MGNNKTSIAYRLFVLIEMSFACPTSIRPVVPSVRLSMQLTAPPPPALAAKEKKNDRNTRQTERQRESSAEHCRLPYPGNQSTREQGREGTKKRSRRVPHDNQADKENAV